MKNSANKQTDTSNRSQLGSDPLLHRLQQIDVPQLAYMARDYGRLNQLASSCLRQRNTSALPAKSTAALQQQLQRSNQVYQQRLGQCPTPSYDGVLPICAKIEEIRAAIMAEPVVVVAGDTGSGKSTQLPKICLQAGRGLRGFIGHTQPRRIAARSVAERISEELKTELGTVVGYKVRFNDHTRPESYIKLMTDGILLAELQRDRYLSQYDTIIIDEAHERSLNIDFILGYLKKLLIRRKDLKVIVTSATIDTEKFSKHFYNAPVISVEGRTFPVTVHNVELERDDKDDVSRIVRDTLVTIVNKQEKGDILVFLSGEAEIRRCMEVINKSKFTNILTLPLYSRLANNAQHAIFKPSKLQKIILATNIAETSLTIPGIKYVIDPGYARISRYNFRRKVQRLPIEKISQASANQRKGRCGRVSEGVCYRLYTQDDFEQRPEFTEPEIKRSNLASVILQMEASKLGDIRSFAFIDPPDKHYINDGYKLLFELAAVDEQHRLTKIGQQLARYPVDPRLAKMLLSAVKEQCVYEMVVIVSALSIQDIREQSIDQTVKTQLAQQHFYEANGAKQSDFMFFINVWEEIKTLKMGQLKRFCKQYHFSFLRMIEWRDIVKQVSDVVREMSKDANEGLNNNNREIASYNQIHRAILPGLISLVGVKNDDNSYQAPRNSNFLVSHRSVAHKKSFKWLMAESMIHTNRLYANNVAKIYPKWIEQMAQHLLKTSYYDIDWDEQRGGVVAYESTSLYGLTIQSRRKIDYGKRDPEASQPFFIQKALVERQLNASLPFLEHNFDLLEKMENLESKFRVRNILVSDSQIFELYQQQLPKTVCSEETLRMWLKSNPRQAEQLKFQQQDICTANLHSLEHDDFPDIMQLRGHSLQLSYVFEPGHVNDGISVDVPIFLLNSIQEQDFDCLVPGLLKQKLVALIKTLPKSVRTSFIPATNYADQCVQNIVPGKGAIQDQFADLLQQRTGKKLSPDSWQMEKLPEHLQMNFRIRANNGTLLKSGRELSLLKFLLNEDVEQAESEVPKSDIERDDITSWDFGRLPKKVQLKVNNFDLQKYPSIVDNNSSVSIKLFNDAEQAKIASRDGIRRLFTLARAKKVKYMRRNIPNLEKMSLLYTSLGSAADFQHSLETLIIDSALFNNITVDNFACSDDFERHAAEAEKSLLLVMNETSELLYTILEHRREVTKLIQKLGANAKDIKADLEGQMARLFSANFIIDIPMSWLQRYPAYLQAITKRLANYPRSPAADQDRQQQLVPYEQQYTEMLNTEELCCKSDAIQRFRWMLEEFRISLFAQGIRTVEPISRQRLDRQVTECYKKLNL